MSGFDHNGNDIVIELIALLSLCTLDELALHGRSHLWLDPDGNLKDLDPAEPLAVKRDWIERGFKYDLQETEDKRRVCKALDTMNETDMRAQQRSMTSAVSSGVVSFFQVQDYLNALLKFLISELLMNTIRYDREKSEDDIHTSYQNKKSDWDAFLENVLSTCRLGVDQIPALITLRLKNMKCILIMYLQEARYKGRDAKLARGKWGKALWTVYTHSTSTLHSIDLQSQVPADAWQEAVDQILNCAQ